jgi:hypothetical protein
MSERASFRPTRILALVAIGPIFLAILILLIWVRLKLERAGITGFISSAFTLKPIRAFGLQYLSRILLPIYLVGGIVFWIVTLAGGTLFRREWFRQWKGREALGLGLSGMVWGHLVLWWQVPTALWVLPGVRSLPFWLVFPLLAALALAFPVAHLARVGGLSRLQRGGMLASWLFLWTILTLAPGWIPRPAPRAMPGAQACKVLMLGIDGLRSDTFLEDAGGLQGIRYRNTYTVIPATRLLWHILWGGDPMTYTIGHVGTSKEELEQPHDLQLIRDASAAGWKPRFYMDDGGTISVAGRRMDLDDILMPAAGWENFVNSNLAVNFPFYAVWENWMKPFPTTNPWARADAGLKEALRLGRGSGWVMFHSCLAHQPIFLNRQELGRTGRWWALSPLRFEPKADISLVTRRDVTHPDLRTNPFTAYQIRMDSILRAWEPIWNGLARDPHYQGAARFLFSDHGERFHTVAKGYQLQGVHGYSLDPWECRATLLAAGPGFSERVEPAPRETTISLLSFVKGMRHLLDKKGPLDATYLESCVPVAPIRYHSLSTNAFGPEPFQFRAEAEKDLATNTYIAPGGIFYIEYGNSAKERAKDASVAWAQGPDLHVFRPLKAGGAKEFHYLGYDLQEIRDLDEAGFQKEKAKVEALLTRTGD